jgi:hypothetical protein
MPVASVMSVSASIGNGNNPGKHGEDDVIMIDLLDIYKVYLKPT